MADRLRGGCRCGAVSYTVAGTPQHHALCHCEACRRSSGAYVIGWALYPRAAVAITGEATSYESSPGTVRQFCGQCGTGLFFINEAIFPGMIDVQSATLETPDRLPAAARIQLADAPAWFHDYAQLPGFERFPAGPA